MIDSSKKLIEIFNDGIAFENLAPLVRGLCQNILSCKLEEDPNLGIMETLSSNYERYTRLGYDYKQDESEQFQEIVGLYEKAKEHHKQQVRDYEQRIKEKESEGSEDIPF